MVDSGADDSPFAGTRGSGGGASTSASSSSKERFKTDDLTELTAESVRTSRRDSPSHSDDDDWFSAS